MSETSLLPREKQVDGRLNIGVDKMLEDLERDTQQRDGSITFWIHWGLIWLNDFDNFCSIPNLGDLEVTQTGG